MTDSFTNVSKNSNVTVVAQHKSQETFTKLWHRRQRFPHHHCEIQPCSLWHAVASHDRIQGVCSNVGRQSLSLSRTHEVATSRKWNCGGSYRRYSWYVYFVTVVHLMSMNISSQRISCSHSSGEPRSMQLWRKGSDGHGIRRFCSILDRVWWSHAFGAWAHEHHESWWHYHRFALRFRDHWIV